MALLAWLARPGLVYRLARWRLPADVGHGRLVAQVHGRGSVRLNYRNPAGGGRAECLRRQLWALRVPASCGASRVTLREEGCLAQGDPACHYVVTWSDGGRPLPAALAGVLTAGALWTLAVAPAVWLLVPMVTAATHVVERWLAARASPLAAAQSRAAFRWLLTRAPAAPSDEHSALRAPAPPAPDAGVSIEPEGDVWRVAYEGTTVRLRRSRGLALLAHLVRNPGREIHVSQLDAITPSDATPGSHGARPIVVSGDAGELLDAQARTEYRRRIRELRNEVEDAGERADLGRAEAARAELERLEDELRVAVGAGGRPRRAASDIERLRGAISHRIRAAMTQIARRHPALGTHLAATVSTGYRCIYRPTDRPTVNGPALGEPSGRRPQPKA